MAPEGDALPPHRRLIWHLETALDCLSEADAADGFLPHWATQAVRRMTEDLTELLERVGRESPALAPRGEDELGDDGA